MKSSSQQLLLVQAGTSQPIVVWPVNGWQKAMEFKMKIAAMTLLAALAATPALAQSPADNDSTASTNSRTAVAPGPENSNVDDQTAAADAARQQMYKHKLDAAKAQSQADNAIADRDAARAQADQDRAEKNAAEDRAPQ